MKKLLTIAGMTGVILSMANAAVSLVETYEVTCRQGSTSVGLSYVPDSDGSGFLVHNEEARPIQGLRCQGSIEVFESFPAQYGFRNLECAKDDRPVDGAKFTIRIERNADWEYSITRRIEAYNWRTAKYVDEEVKLGDAFSCSVRLVKIPEQRQERWLGE
ncbi:MAG: hypothetical protein NDJ89_06335 [Oligoflexia bacterium]|nr:hypothetical protein [Oligoflexia bacterium]